MAGITLRANITTDSAGNATAYVSRGPGGQSLQSPYPLAPIAGLWYVESISYVKNEFASGVDFSITEHPTGREVWVETNVDASETHSDPVAIADGQIKIVIANGGDTKAGSFIIKLVDTAGTEVNVSGGGGLSDGDYGDVAVSGSGTVMDVESVAGVTPGTLGLALLDDANAAAGRTTLGLGTLATQSGTFSGTSSGTNTGDQTSIVGISGTKAEFNTAVSDGNIQFVGDAPAAHSHVQSDLTGLTTADSPQFAGVNVGHVSDTTITRTGAGDIAVEGNALYRAGGTDVPVADGGTGASTASGARTNLGLVIDTDVAPAALTAAPGSDHTFSGPRATMTAGEDLVFPDVVYVKSDGKMGKADADAESTSSVFAIASATIANNASGVFILPGSFIRDDTWNWTVGGLIYLSTTAGALTQTKPSGTDDVVIPVGIATHADRMFFNPPLTLMTVV